MPKTAKTATPYRGRPRFKTKASQAIHKGKKTTRRQTLSTRYLKDVLSEPVAGVPLSAQEAQILLHIYDNSGQSFQEWPEALQADNCAPRMQTRGLLRAKSFPTRYYLTRLGFSVASILKSPVNGKATGKA